MVQANETTAYPHPWLASKLNIPMDLLEETLEICKKQKRISENDTGIKVLKFEFYQEKKSQRGKKEKGDDPDKFIKGPYGDKVKR